MSSGADGILPLDAAMQEYERIRAAYRRHGGERAGAINRAQMVMFERLTGPYRVVRFTEYLGEQHPHYMVFLMHGHGLEEQVWYFRGDHRERDAVRMSVMLRNQLLLTQREALEGGDIHWSLRHCMAEVRALSGQGGCVQDRQAEP